MDKEHLFGDFEYSTRRNFSYDCASKDCYRTMCNQQEQRERNQRVRRHVFAAQAFQLGNEFNAIVIDDGTD